MGQACPLPEKIPNPRHFGSPFHLRDSLVAKMTSLGIIKSSDNDQYVNYILPSQWRMLDLSKRKDLPNWVIIDENNNKQFAIHGCWKETYDNRLEIFFGDNTQYVLEQLPHPKPSETTSMAIGMRFSEQVVSLIR